jgi:spore germination cell wall hydrolase CwlJ-like protein
MKKILLIQAAFLLAGILAILSTLPSDALVAATSTPKITATARPTTKSIVKLTMKPTPKLTKRTTPKQTKTVTKSTPKPTAKAVSMSDLDLLARLVHQEARGGSDEMQLLIANVVINRVNDPRFPNTIRGVIYQKGQYSGAGSIGSVRPNEDCVENARRVLNGERFCPAKVVWQSEGRQGRGLWKRVGNMYFCY